MANVRSSDNQFEIVDYTDEILSIPNTWGLIGSLGIFTGEGLSQNTLQFDLTSSTLTLLTDQPRGVRNLANKRDRSTLKAVAVPHFNFDDAIKPEDVQGKRRVGSANDLDTVALQRAKIMLRMRRSWAATMEYARSLALQGTVYAPNGTVSINWFTEMGATQKVVDFVLGTTGTFVPEKAAEAISHIQDNILSGETITKVVALCSPEFFAKFIKHASVTDAYRYFSSVQNPLRDSLRQGIEREFTHAGITWIEYRGSFNGTAIIPAGDVYFVPMGTSDTFKTYYSPANKFAHVNTIGEEQYMFEYDNGRDTEITIETESNFLNMVRRPAAVVRGHSSN